jgi:hypothetical protein
VHVNQGGSGGGLIQVRIRGAEANHTLVSSTASMLPRRPETNSIGPTYSRKT